MWNSNSVIAWVIARSGLEAESIEPPQADAHPGGRPGSRSRAGTQLVSDLPSVLGGVFDAGREEGCVARRVEPPADGLGLQCRGRVGHADRRSARGASYRRTPRGSAWMGSRSARAGCGSLTPVRGVARVLDPVFRNVARSLPVGRPVRCAAGRGLVRTRSGSSLDRAARSRAWTRARAGRSRGSRFKRRAERHRGRGRRRVGHRQRRRHREEDRLAHERRSRPRSRSGQSVGGIAVGGGGVWVAVPLEDRVKRIDPTSNVIADTVRVQGGPSAVAAGAGGRLGARVRARTLTRIDPGLGARDSHDPARPQPAGRGHGRSVPSGWRCRPARLALTAAGTRGTCLRVLHPDPRVRDGPCRDVGGGAQVFAGHLHDAAQPPGPALSRGGEAGSGGRAGDADRE